MFVFNLKINPKRIFVALGVLLTIVLIFFIVNRFVLNNKSKVNDEIAPSKHIGTIDNNNYTDTLKMVHENLDMYLGQEVKITGFVYRLNDFQDDQFVIARNMVIDSTSNPLVVGLLCSFFKSEDFEDGAWVEIQGIISQVEYNGTIPSIKVKNMTRIEKPEDEYVSTPSDTYIPTSVIM